MSDQKPDPLPDPVDWEARYRAGDTPWDEGTAAPALVEFLARHPIRGEVFVPGSGGGHDVRALATQGADVLGLDLSPTAIGLARSFPPAGSERYEQGDLFHLPPSWHGRFDWVVEHTCFCAIPPARRADYARAISLALKPGGHYLGIFYMNPSAPQGPPHGTTREEISSLFEPGFILLEEWTPRNNFEGREGRELCQLRRKVDRVLG
ncbi:MAG: methyltransferase domain-containing protein [Chthoniobacterales bacterium]